MGVWPLPGSNEIEVANRLHVEMARIRPTLPSDIDMQMAYDATVFMTDALQEISKTLVETILIVGLVVFLFMGSIRTALVPLVAMPVSLVGAAIVMYAFGFSLNLLTILAIVLSVGLVVDDAIVVVENVERHVREGKTRIQAALVGARELVGPIIAMTITLAAVYTPIGFQGGLTGSLFLEFAITLAAAVVVSGLVAVTLSPVMSSRFVHEAGREGRLTKLVHHAFEAVRRRYERLLDGALQMRWAIVAAAVRVMLAAVPLDQGLQVFPRLHPRLPTPGQYDVELILASDVPPDQMLQTVGAVLGAGWQSGKFLYVDTDLKIDLPEARVVIDRDQVADLGLDLASVGRELGTLLGGGYVNRFNYFDRSYKVIPQIGDDRRTTVGPLLDLKFKSFRDPLIVLVGSVPLAISGALVFSFLDLTTINIYSQVGLITLVGLIAKNGILIVQFANTLQSQGVAKLVALRQASLTRLRP